MVSWKSQVLLFFLVGVWGWEKSKNILICLPWIHFACWWNGSQICCTTPFLVFSSVVLMVNEWCSPELGVYGLWKWIQCILYDVVLPCDEWWPCHFLKLSPWCKLSHEGRGQWVTELSWLVCGAEMEVPPLVHGINHSPKHKCMESFPIVENYMYWKNGLTG